MRDACFASQDEAACGFYSRRICATRDRYDCRSELSQIAGTAMACTVLASLAMMYLTSLRPLADVELARIRKLMAIHHASRLTVVGDRQGPRLGDLVRKGDVHSASWTSEEIRGRTRREEGWPSVCVRPPVPAAHGTNRAHSGTLGLFRVCTCSIVDLVLFSSSSPRATASALSFVSVILCFLSLDSTFARHVFFNFPPARSFPHRSPPTANHTHF